MIGGILIGAGLALAIAVVIGSIMDWEIRAIVGDFLRDGLPLLLLWLGLRLMSRKTRQEMVYGFRHRHTMRGIPDLYQGLHARDVF